MTFLLRSSLCGMVLVGLLGCGSGPSCRDTLTCDGGAGGTTSIGETSTSKGGRSSGKGGTGGATTIGGSKATGGSTTIGGSKATGGSTSTVIGSTDAGCEKTCTGDTPVCDTNRSQCVGCMANADCKSATKPVCNLAVSSCVECLANTDCKALNASRCDATSNTCVSCQSDADCSQIDGRHVCSAGMCVQCTGKKYEACGQLDGKGLVCNSITQTCTKDKTSGASGLCQPCVSDAQCPAGQLCYQQMFTGKPVGYFCFWKQGDTGNGAPTDCTVSSNRPYSRIESDVSSIDGTVATLCTLRSTTCAAYNQFGNVDCARSGPPNDDLCGFAPGADSKCGKYGMITYRCTTVCLANDDCKPGVTCNTGVTPNVCTFQ
jgi:hypothetical protein